MTKITVCDVCLTRHDKIMRTTRYISVSRHRELRLDLCNLHMFEVKKKFPKVSVEFVQYVYKVAHKTELTDEDAQFILRQRK